VDLELVGDLIEDLLAAGAVLRGKLGEASEQRVDRLVVLEGKLGAMTTLYLEDFKPGDTFEFGRHTFTREEIVAFARQYDPQPFHVDEEAARRSIYGGLIASGWQTVGVTFRLAVEGLIGRVASMGSPGVDEIRWLRPVRPGDTITARAEVLEVRPSASKPDRGVIRIRYEALNQRGETVLTMVGLGLFGRRPA
jgi:acyl dehydratase